MFGTRLRISATLRLQQDLHLGSGLRKPGRQRTGDVAEAETLLVQRGTNGRAVIPGTSLKGALRAAARQSGADTRAIAELFGPAKIQTAADGQIGRLWLHAALGRGDTDRRSELARLARDSSVGRDGFDRTRLRIDRNTGAAEANMLFNEELIAAGAEFEFEALLLLDGPSDEAAIAGTVDDLGRVLGPLLRDGGLALGAGARRGQGRALLLGETLQMTLLRIEPSTGILVGTPREDLVRRITRIAAPPAAQRWRHEIRLVCDGPFITIRDNVPADGDDDAQITPVGRGGNPELWPSSLLGALRARAAWLAARERLRAGRRGLDPERFSAIREDGSADPEIDNRSKLLSDKRKVQNLSSVERLFGVAGWRGEVRLSDLAFTGPITGLHRATGAPIDRFTGGVRQGTHGRGAFFKEDTWLEPQFRAVIEWVPRSKSERRTVDAELLDLLLADLRDVTLFLGHGASKGFGWFGVTVTAQP